MRSEGSRCARTTRQSDMPSKSRYILHYIINFETNNYNRSGQIFARWTQTDSALELLFTFLVLVSVGFRPAWKTNRQTETLLILYALSPRTQLSQQWLPGNKLKILIFVT